MESGVKLDEALKINTIKRELYEINFLHRGSGQQRAVSVEF
jgi:hypothetical protein